MVIDSSPWLRLYIFSDLLVHKMITHLIDDVSNIQALC